jgi:hypothetical protein
MRIRRGENSIKRHSSPGYPKSLLEGSGVVGLYRAGSRELSVSRSVRCKYGAAVGDLNNHYPTIFLERKVLSREKRWEDTTSIRCHTVTLAGRN